MAEVASAPQPNQQVPLDTIPISPTENSAEGEEQSSTNNAGGEGEIRTVFHDPENFNVKHPLMNTWTLWFTKPPSGKGDNWAELLKEVISFDSVEEFWGIYNNITPTSDLALKSDYHLFKKGVRPEWEDAQNKHGGKWAFQFKDKKSSTSMRSGSMLCSLPSERTSRTRTTMRSWVSSSTLGEASTVSVCGPPQSAALSPAKAERAGPRRRARRFC